MDNYFHDRIWYQHGTHNKYLQDVEKLAEADFRLIVNRQILGCETHKYTQINKKQYRQHVKMDLCLFLVGEISCVVENFRTI